MLYKCTHNICEGPGAAAINELAKIKGCKVSVIASGGNFDQNIFLLF
tara:strand:- start:64 stop:204 length:141 start_codon:yes stop_codon:yes gene_type:complete